MTSLRDDSLVAPAKHGVVLGREFAIGPDALAVGGDLSGLLEGDAQRLGTH